MSKTFWPISGFYFFYFSILGVLVPYWGLYLKHLGFNAVQIGQLVAIISLTKIVSPMLWSWLSDRFGHTMRMVRLSSFVSFIFFCFVFVSNTYWAMAWSILAFSFFWNATLPQFEMNTFEHLGKKNLKQYSQIRVWGSIGFIVTVILIGFLTEQQSISILPAISAVLFFMLWLMSLKVTDAITEHHVKNTQGFFAIIKQKQVMVLLAVILLSQLSHGAYYSFFSIYLEETGYSETSIGFFWSLAVLAEVIVFLVMHHFISTIGVHRLLGLSLVLTAIRWLMIAFLIDYAVIVLIAQILHAATFGVFHVVIVYIVTQYFSPNHKSLGQALYVSVGFGIGGAVGAVLAGAKWESWGGEGVFFVFSLFSILGVWIFYQFADYKKL